MKTQNIKTSKKFFIVFAVAVVLLLGTSTMGIFSSRSLMTTYQSFYTGNYRFSVLLHESELAISDGLTMVSQAMAHDSQAQVKSLIDGSFDYFQEAKDLLAQAKELADESQAGSLAELEGYVDTFLNYAADFSAMTGGEILAQKTEVVTGLNSMYAAVQQVCETLNTGADALASGGRTRMQTIFRVVLLTLTVMPLLAVAFLVFCGVRLTRDITRPTMQILRALRKMEQGDLDVSGELTYQGRDELGQLAESVRVTADQTKGYMELIVYAMEELVKGNLAVENTDAEAHGIFARVKDSILREIATLSEVVSGIQAAAEQITAGSEQVANGAQALAQGATEQASSVEELAAHSGELAAGAKRDADVAHRAYAEEKEAAGHLDTCNRSMAEMREAMDDIYKSQQDIQSIISSIEDIAFQTNILALNAAVEAARAGAAGKGFAVVADEVRTLAGNSAKAAEQTTSLVSECLEAVGQGSAVAKKTAEALERIKSSVGGVTERTAGILAVAEEQLETAGTIESEVEQISNVVQTTAAAAEQVAASVREISEQMDILDQLGAESRTRHDDAEGVIL